MVALRSAWLLVALGVCACSSSSGSGSAIVGEWSTSSTGNGVEEWFFNSNGTCGVLLAQNNVSICTSSSCTYTFDGTTLSLTTATTSSSGATTTTTNDWTIAFTQGGSAAMVTGACESSVCASLTFTRVNSNDGNRCP
jgi:hypothetical protein